jgi:hypothetical protein
MIAAARVDDAQAAETSIPKGQAASIREAELV